MYIYQGIISIATVSQITAIPSFQFVIPIFAKELIFSTISYEPVIPPSSIKAVTTAWQRLDGWRSIR